MIVAAALFIVSVTDVAVNVTMAGLGTVGGAVYVIGAPDALELLETEPQAAPLQPAPESVQVTPLFCASFCTVAVKLSLCPV